MLDLIWITCYNDLEWYNNAYKAIKIHFSCFTYKIII